MAKILISMPDEFLNKVDDFATSEQRTRSELIREALRSYVKRSRVIDVAKNEERAKVLENLLE